MEASTFFYIIVTAEALLALILVVLAIINKCKNVEITFWISILMVIISIVAMSIQYCKIISYDGGTEYIISEAEFNEKLNTYSVKTTEGFSEKDVGLYVFSTNIDKSILLKNARILIENPLGIQIYIRKNLVVAVPSTDVTKMSMSERKSYINELNNITFKLK